MSCHNIHIKPMLKTDATHKYNYCYDCKKNYSSQGCYKKHTNSNKHYNNWMNNGNKSFNVLLGLIKNNVDSNLIDNINSRIIHNYFDTHKIRDNQYSTLGERMKVSLTYLNDCDIVNRMIKYDDNYKIFCDIDIPESIIQEYNEIKKNKSRPRFIPNFVGNRKINRCMYGIYMKLYQFKLYYEYYLLIKYWELNNYDNLEKDTIKKMDKVQKKIPIIIDELENMLNLN